VSGSCRGLDLRFAIHRSERYILRDETHHSSLVRFYNMIFASAVGGGGNSTYQMDDYPQDHLLRITFHTCRSTFGDIFVASGEPLRDNYLREKEQQHHVMSDSIVSNLSKDADGLRTDLDSLRGLT